MSNGTGSDPGEYPCRDASDPFFNGLSDKSAGGDSTILKADDKVDGLRDKSREINQSTEFQATLTKLVSDTRQTWLRASELVLELQKLGKELKRLCLDASGPLKSGSQKRKTNSNVSSYRRTSKT